MRAAPDAIFACFRGGTQRDAYLRRLRFAALLRDLDLAARAFDFSFDFALATRPLCSCLRCRAVFASTTDGATTTAEPAITMAIRPAMNFFISDFLRDEHSRSAMRLHAPFLPQTSDRRHRICSMSTNKIVGHFPPPLAGDPATRTRATKLPTASPIPCGFWAVRAPFRVTLRARSGLASDPA